MDVSITARKSTASANTKSGTLYVIEYKYVSRPVASASGITRLPSVNRKLVFDTFPLKGKNSLLNADPGLYLGIHPTEQIPNLSLTFIKGQHITKVLNLGNGQYWRVRE